MPVTKLVEILRFIKYMLDRGYDFMMLISGDEGVGKSRGLLLNIIDIWYKEMLHQDINHLPFVTDFTKFPKLLQESKPYDIAALDEAGDALDNTKYGEKMKIMLYRTYTIIREKKIFSIFVMPSVFDLSGKFVKRRVRMLLHADHRVDNYCPKCKIYFTTPFCPKCFTKDFKKGYVYYVGYRREALRALIDINSRLYLRKLSYVTPTFSGVISEYKGKLIKDYEPMKKEKANQVLDVLQYEMDKIQNKEEKTKEKAEINLQKKKDPFKCPICGRRSIFYSKREGQFVCKSCGYVVGPTLEK